MCPPQAPTSVPTLLSIELNLWVLKNGMSELHAGYNRSRGTVQGLDSPGGVQYGRHATPGTLQVLVQALLEEPQAAADRPVGASSWAGSGWRGGVTASGAISGVLQLVVVVKTVAVVCLAPDFSFLQRLGKQIGNAREPNSTPMR
eukprot:CAMPEP_0174299246 /NCGR_PEP_ID=MMETSP0809-20121228/56143_1 /TAXON_ID=73025 ORGANISM="Eutreptiella gymnastica-like, Strain CCMP1594" /NCGR_SAMPLE_ID=MMETSP0809 /ASSEMBLY_ACC=CAM_ASM_000658 /LENGTH=144 /DNA_ID=CAMNT_0015404277 /DNA_START=167 /DNA_END=601 /DNA_ORIENTATION=+